MYESIFSQRANAKKKLIFSTGPVCEICGKIFTELRNLVQHRRTIHENPDTFSCAECTYAIARRCNLNRHIMKRHASTPITSNHPPKVACRESSIINPPPNDCLFVQNTQRGFGLSPTDVPDEVHRVFKRNNHGEQTKISVKFTFKIFIAFATHKPSTENPESTFDTSATPPLSLISLSMPLRISSNIKPMLSKSTSLFLLFSNTERLVSSDIIMPATTNQLLNTPRLIRNQQDLNNLLNFLASQDFPSHLKDQRPNTKWVIERIVSLRIHLVMTTYPLGKPPHLPDYIKNNRYIIALEKDEHNAYRYKDHLYFFRCLAIAKFNSLAITVAKKPKISLTNIVFIFQLILKNLKVLNCPISLNLRSFIRCNYLPCF